MSGAQQARGQPQRGLSAMMQNPLLQFGLQALSQTGGQGIAPTSFGQQFGQAGLATMQALSREQQQKVTRDYIRSQVERMKAKTEAEKVAQEEEESQRKRLQALAEKDEITPKDLLFAGYPDEYVKLVTEEMKRGNEPPKYIGQGMVWDPNTGQAAPIEGYASRAGQIAEAQAAARARHRAPPRGRQPTRKETLARLIATGEANPAQQREWQLLGPREKERGVKQAGIPSKADIDYGMSLMDADPMYKVLPDDEMKKAARRFGSRAKQIMKETGLTYDEAYGQAMEEGRSEVRIKKTGTTLFGLGETPVGKFLGIEPTPVGEARFGGPPIEPEVEEPEEAEEPKKDRKPQVTTEQINQVRNIIFELPAAKRMKGTKIMTDLRIGKITREEAFDKLSAL